MSLHPIFEEALRPFAPRFAQTHCSQCGQPQGAGNSGYSACKQHNPLPSFKATLGDNIEVEAFYEHTPAEAAVYDVESPVCGPGHDAEVEICEVMLAGEDVRNLLADSVIESLEEQAFARVES